jgi:hypothetical protein
MTIRTALFLGLATALAAVVPLRAQTRTAKPSITGSWEIFPLRGEGFGSGIQPKTPVAAPKPIPEPPLRQPYLDQWKALQAENLERTRKGLPPPSTGMACMPDGIPGMMQATFPMEILETPGQVTVIEEAFNQVRRIYLNEALPALDDAEPRFNGHSVGKWEGNTLVVTTIGVKEMARFRNVPHSAKMRVTERWRLVTDEMLENQVTVEDSEYLTAPWTWSWMYHRWPGYKIEEYVCEDNRYFEDPAQKYQRLRVN